MDERMMEERSSKSLLHNATHFNKSLKELNDFSCQLYNAADYCKTAFLNSQDKKHILETTKEYICRAVVVVVDHLGAVSDNLEHCIPKSDIVSETEDKINTLKQRIGTCQHYSYKLSLARFHWGSEFSRHHCRYTSLPPFEDPTIISAVSSYPESCIDAKNDEGTSTKDIVKITTRDYKYLVPVGDGLSILPKTEHSTFRFQMQKAQRQKRGMMDWKLMQRKDFKTLIRRTKRILT